MGLMHVFGILFGAGLLTVSKLFWLGLCYALADSFETLTQGTCGVFEGIFFWTGVLIIAVSFIGLFRKH